MPRHHRIAYPGALYYITNAGIARSALFHPAATARTFLQCLFEACERTGWTLFAFSLEKNRFHLAVATPRPNLVQGMHWLETAFCVRLRRGQPAAGPVFGGRYTALLVEPGLHLTQLVNAIHCRQPVAPRCGSLHTFQNRHRPGRLSTRPWLAALGFADSPRGWSGYRTLLAWLRTEHCPPGAKALPIRGWALGRSEWRAEIRARHGVSVRSRQEAREEWSAALAALLRRRHRTAAEVRAAPRAAPWKLEIAEQLRRHTTASNDWLAQKLSIGSGGALSVYLSRRRRGIRS